MFLHSLPRLCRYSQAMYYFFDSLVFLTRAKVYDGQLEALQLKSFRMWSVNEWSLCCVAARLSEYLLSAHFHETTRSSGLFLGMVDKLMEIAKVCPALVSDVHVVCCCVCHRPYRGVMLWTAEKAASSLASGSFFLLLLARVVCWPEPPLCLSHGDRLPQLVGSLLSFAIVVLTWL